MLEQYGPSNEATPRKLFWYKAGPWKRIVVTRDLLIHNFPAPHSDFLMQVIDYRVPPEKRDEIARFDGSYLVDRTAGEVAARCDSEAANTLTLNVMHEIVTGKITVDEARKTLGGSRSRTRWAGLPRTPRSSSLQFPRAEQRTRTSASSMRRRLESKRPERQRIC